MSCFQAFCMWACMWERKSSLSERLWTFYGFSLVKKLDVRSQQEILCRIHRDQFHRHSLEGVLWVKRSHRSQFARRTPKERHIVFLPLVEGGFTCVLTTFGLLIRESHSSAVSTAPLDSNHRHHVTAATETRRWAQVLLKGNQDESEDNPSRTEGVRIDESLPRLTKCLLCLPTSVTKASD